MPAYRAASSFPPSAYMCLPHLMRERKKPQAMREAARTSVTTATCPPAMRALRKSNTGGTVTYWYVPSGIWTAVEIFCPPETHFASPRANTIMASVEMNGCMRNLPVRYPETVPQASPAAERRARGEERVPAEVHREERKENGGKAQDAPHGEIDPAGDDHHRHSACEDTDHRDLAEHVAVRPPRRRTRRRR